MGPVQTIEDVIGLLLRRRWLILLVAVIGTALAVWYAKTRPATFEATAVVQVQVPMVTESGQPIATNNVAQTLQTIEQRLTTRENLLALIDRHGLFDDAPALSVEDRVVAARASFRFQPVSNANGGGVSAILISANAGTADNAAHVANDLAQSVLDMGAEDHQASADASSTFFNDEEARIWREINALEAEIAAYREANSAALPDARLARQEELNQLGTSIRALDLQLAGLQAEDASLRALQVTRATDRRRLEDIGQQLSVLTAQRTPLVARKTTLESSLGDVAELDRVLSAYDRQLRQLQDQYTVVSTRLAEAETAKRLSDQRQTEQFSILERAITPEYPNGSGRKKIVIAGAVVSTGLALLLAFILDLIRPTLRTSSQLERELNLRPIVAIPDVSQAARKPKGQKAISSLVLSEMAKLPARGSASNLVILGGAVLILMVAAAAMA